LGLRLETSGWAEAPGDVSHRRCARWRVRWWSVCRGRFARRLPLRGWDCVWDCGWDCVWKPAVGRKPPAMFRTEGARAVECVVGVFAVSFCPQAAAMRLNRAVVRLTLRCMAPEAKIMAPEAKIRRAGGLTSTVRIVTTERIQITKSGAPNTVSPSRLRPSGTPSCRKVTATVLSPVRRELRERVLSCNSAFAWSSRSR